MVGLDMAKWGKTDYKQFEKMKKQIDDLVAGQWDEAMRRVANRVAQILINRTKKLTPVGKKPKLDGAMSAQVTGSSGKSRSFLTKNGAIMQQYWSGYTGGKLRDSWGVKVTQQGKNFVIELSNDTIYASYVEYGHRQTPGRYVPALGKTLKASWVNGKFMMTKSVSEVERKVPKMLEQELYQTFREVFNQ